MLAFYNVWGINPSKNYSAAGYDFYIPNINDYETDLLETEIKPALCKSYDVTLEQLEQLRSYLQVIIADRYYSDEDDERGALYSFYKESAAKNQWNCVHLLLAHAFKSSKPVIDMATGFPLSYNITKFVYDNLTFDKAGNVGIVMKAGETLFINSGIKEKVPTGYAGVFFNKSGRASSGYDTRACVVDEDYTGFVHLNVQFTSEKTFNSEIYCGDKLVQQLILPLYSMSGAKFVGKEEYDELQFDSNRGENGFGSSNEKH